MKYDISKLETCGHCPGRTECDSPQNVADFTEKVFKPAVQMAWTQELIDLGNSYCDKSEQSLLLNLATQNDVYAEMSDSFAFYVSLIAEELTKRAAEGDTLALAFVTEQGWDEEFHTANMAIQARLGADLPTSPASMNHPQLN
jgi:hypothetical protein